MSPQVRNAAGGFDRDLRQHEKKANGVTVMAATTGGAKERAAVAKGVQEKVDPYAVEAQLVEEDKGM